MKTQVTPPEEFICPLTKELITDPIVSRYGDNFERSAILQWLSEGNDYCPVTGNPLRPSCLVSNKSLEWKIRCWLREQGEEAPEKVEPDFLTGSFCGFVAVVPEKFECALTSEIMQDPVTSTYGNNFERKAILEYLDEHSDTCPVTGKHLFPRNLIPNAALKRKIHDWEERNGDHGENLPELGPIDILSPKRQLLSPKPALVGTRDDYTIRDIRGQHFAKLQIIGSDNDGEEKNAEDPFCATSYIDAAHDTPQSLAHVY